MEPFNPENALESLRKFTHDIGEVGEKLIMARNFMAGMEAGMIDFEEEAEKNLRQDPELSETAIKNQIKFLTSSRRRDFIIAKLRVKELEDRKDILVEINNSLKVALRIYELEYQNLNNQTK